MPWGAAIGAIGGIISADMGGGGGGGGQSNTQSKDPWMPATPWIMDNIVQGQDLQRTYTNTPFNAQQQGAYGAMANDTAYARALIPSLLGQLSGGQLGYDRNNPNARPRAFDFTGGGGSGGSGGGLTGSSGGTGGLLDLLRGSGAATNSSLTPLQPTKPVVEPGEFTQQGAGDRVIQSWNGADYGALMDQEQALAQEGTPANQVGKFGSFTYGMDMPKPGTQAYRDMNEYFSYGGRDPLGKYRTTATHYGGFNGGGGGIGDTGANAAASASGNDGW